MAKFNNLILSNICLKLPAFIYYIFSALLVPTPNISVTAINAQTVGQSLTLQCEVTTVRGITSRVDIVWSSNGMELDRTNGTTPTMMSDSLVYTDSYMIPMLTTSFNARTYECEVVIDADPPTTTSGSIILNVNGKLYMRYSLIDWFCL